MIDCKNPDCNGQATRAFARVFGTNDDEIYACPECCGKTGWKNGAAANEERTHGVSISPR